MAKCTNSDKRKKNNPEVYKICKVNSFMKQPFLALFYMFTLTPHNEKTHLNNCRPTLDLPLKTHTFFITFFISNNCYSFFHWVHILLSHYKVMKCFLSWGFLFTFLNIYSWKALCWVEDVTNNTSWRGISHLGIKRCCCCSN